MRDNTEWRAVARRIEALVEGESDVIAKMATVSCELFHAFDHSEHECVRLIELNLALPAYEQMLDASHLFNLLDARQAISVSERQRFILRVRTMARAVAEAYYNSREELGFPMVDSVNKGKKR